MKKLFYLFVFTFIALMSNSQDNDYKNLVWGEECKIRSYGYPSDFQKFNDNIYGVLDVPANIINTSSEDYLLKFDSNMNLISSEVIDLYVEDENLDLQFSFKIKDKWFFCGSYLNPDSRKNYLFLTEYDVHKDSFNNKYMKVAECRADGIIKYLGNSFGYALSEDSTKILFYGIIPGERKSIFNMERDPDAYKFFVYDSDFNLLWEDISKVHSTKRITHLIQDFKVSNNGDVFLLHEKTGYKGEKNEGKKFRYDYELESFTQNGTIRNSIKVDLDGNHTNGVRIARITDEYINLAGFYSERSNLMLAGAFIGKMEFSDPDTILFKFTEFDKKFLTEHISDRKKKRVAKDKKKNKESEYMSYDIKGLTLFKDSGFIMSTERKVYAFRSIYDSQGNYVRDEYYYVIYDHIVVRMDDSGNLIWKRRIPKKQTTRSSNLPFYYQGRWSYADIVSGNKYYSFYNQYWENFTEDGKGVSQLDAYFMDINPKTDLFTVEIIDEKGDYIQKSLGKFKPHKKIFHPQSTIQISENEVILMKEKKKKYVFGKMTLE